MLCKSMLYYIYIKNNISSQAFTVRIHSDCMVPIIYPNDLVEVILCSTYRKGDIVLVYVDDEIRLHRIIEIKNNKYITKGDNSFKVDSAVENDKILGLASKNITKNIYLNTIKIKKILSYISKYENFLFTKKNKKNHKNLKHILYLRKIKYILTLKYIKNL